MSVEVVPRKGQKGTVFIALMEEPNPNFDPEQEEGPPTNLKFLPIDLTLAVGQGNQIEFRRPNKSTFLRPATVDGDPMLGRLQYINLPSEDSVLDMFGIWAIRGYPAFTDGSSFPGSFFEMRIGR